MLRRLAYLCRFVDLQDIFDRPELELCFLFNTGISFIDAHFKDRLLNTSQPWLTTSEQLEYSAAVHAKGGLWLKAVENKWAKMCDSGCVHSLSLPFDVCYFSFLTTQHKNLDGVSEFLNNSRKRYGTAENTNRYYRTTTIRETTLYHGNRKEK